MYTQVAADLYTGQRLAVSLNFRSALDSFSQTSYPLRNTVPFGFCCGGFSSTAGYVPGNEAQVRRLKRLATPRLINSSKRDCVFIRVARDEPCDPSRSQAFRLQREALIAATAACRRSQTMRHRTICLSSR